MIPISSQYDWVKYNLKCFTVCLQVQLLISIWGKYQICWVMNSGWRYMNTNWNVFSAYDPICLLPSYSLCSTDSCCILNDNLNCFVTFIWEADKSGGRAWEHHAINMTATDSCKHFIVKGLKSCVLCDIWDYKCKKRYTNWFDLMTLTTLVTWTQPASIVTWETSVVISMQCWNL